MLSASGAEVRPATKPNIVFILIDDMGWADGGCFGSKYYRTPNLDTLAAAGMRFTQAYAACAVCSPTRAAIMTGKYPARLHLTDWIPGEEAPKGGLTPGLRKSVPKCLLRRQPLRCPDETVSKRRKTTDGHR
jgi:arylsulfatase A-like enzyme